MIAIDSGWRTVLYTAIQGQDLTSKNNDGVEAKEEEKKKKKRGGSRYFIYLTSFLQSLLFFAIYSLL